MVSLPIPAIRIVPSFGSKGSISLPIYSALESPSRRLSVSGASSAVIYVPIGLFIFLAAFWLRILISEILMPSCSSSLTTTPSSFSSTNSLASSARSVRNCIKVPPDNKFIVNSLPKRKQILHFSYFEEI